MSIWNYLAGGAVTGLQRYRFSLIGLRDIESGHFRIETWAYQFLLYGLCKYMHSLGLFNIPTNFHMVLSWRNHFQQPEDFSFEFDYFYLLVQYWHNLVISYNICTPTRPTLSVFANLDKKKKETNRTIFEFWISQSSQTFKTFFFDIFPKEHLPFVLCR